MDKGWVSAEEVSLVEIKEGDPGTITGPSRFSLEILLALHRLGKHVYEGTVDSWEKQKRRAKNRAARKQRRVNRLRSR